MPGIGRLTLGHIRVVYVTMCSTGFLAAALMLCSWAEGGERSSAAEREKRDRTAAERVKEPGSFSYVGNKRCGMCHFKWKASWQESAKADSWKSLKPGRKPLVKERAGLERSTDYTTHGRCLTCHAVGYGKPGGYEIPDPQDRRSVRRAEARQGAGCESCHGPGSGYAGLMSEILEENRTYHPREVRRAGRSRVTLDVCTRCHNHSAVCQTGVDEEHRRPYDPTVSLDDHDGYHEHFRLPRRRREEVNE